MNVFMLGMKRVAFAAVAFAAGLGWAGPIGDRPDARHAWAVHDENRPAPANVTAEPGKAPSDAVWLFDGTAESVAKHWCNEKGEATAWYAKDGMFVCMPKKGMACSREKFADCQIHVEFRIPDPPGKGEGNSGVYVKGLYEIQVIDSFTPKAGELPWNSYYADGQLGAIYGQSPALVNAARAPGEWQVFDIVFHPAHIVQGEFVEPARLTVFLNGVLVQDGWPLEGPTNYRRRMTHDAIAERGEGPLKLQDHGNPVSYRNIWIRRIPSPRDNQVNGGDHFDAAKAAALRARLAADALARAHAAKKTCDRIVWLWESWCYENDDAVRAEVDAATAQYMAELADTTRPEGEDWQAERLQMREFVNMLVRNGLLTGESPLAKAVK